MRSPRIVLFSVSLLVAGLIVVRSASPVNHNQMNTNQQRLELVDGAPLPPPHSDANTMLLADRAPLPSPHQAVESAVSAQEPSNLTQLEMVNFPRRALVASLAS
jgi:hypothetical protein